MWIRAAAAAVLFSSLAAAQSSFTFGAGGTSLNKITDPNGEIGDCPTSSFKPGPILCIFLAGPRVTGYVTVTPPANVSGTIQPNKGLQLGPATFSVTTTGLDSVPLVKSVQISNGDQNGVPDPGVMSCSGGSGSFNCVTNGLLTPPGPDNNGQYQVRLNMKIQLDFGFATATLYYGFYFFLVPAAPAQSSFKIDHVEAIQVVQNAAGDEVPFIAGKDTLVRVFVVSTSSQDVKVTGKLNGQAPYWGDTIAHQAPAPRTIRIGIDQGTLDFEIANPPVGTVKLSIDLATTDDDAKGVVDVHMDSSLNFVAAKNAPADFYVGYLRVCTIDASGNEQCPDSPYLDEAGDVAASQFPFPNGTIQYFAIPVPKVDVQFGAYPAFDMKVSTILFKYLLLLNVYKFPGVPQLDHVVGFLPDVGREYERLATDLGLTPLISWGEGAKYPYSRSGLFVAHRLGHQFGLKDHTGPTSEVGWANWFRYVSHGFIETGSNENLMSLGSWKDSVESAMITPADYNMLIKNPAVVSAAVHSLRPNVTATTDYVVVSGTVQRDGSGAQIDPVYHVSTTQPQTPSNPSGNHCLQFSSGSGVLGQYCFDLNVTPTGVAGLDQQIFAVAAPWPAGTTQLALLRGGSTLATVTAAQDPVVTILSPTAGAQLQGSTTISWSVTGAAGAVASTVLYSPDGGTSWLPMITDTTDTQYTFDASQILGGSQVFLRVMAASGLNSGTATIGPINVIQTPKIGAALPTLDFGNVVVGQVVPQTVAITSTGTGPLTISGFSVDNPAFTVVTNTSAGSLQPGQQLNLTVNLNASGAGAQKGTLTITSNDPSTPSFTIPLTGAVFTSAQPSIAAIQLPIDFGNVPAGQTGEMALPLVNSSAASLSVTSINSSDPQFVVGAPSAPLTIAGEQDVTLKFTPSSTSLRTATITVASNDPTHASLMVQVKGTGTAANSAGPQLKSGGVVNGASFQGAVVPGGLATIFGSNFTAGGATGQAQALPLPFTLAGVSVTVAGIPAPLIYVSAGQINFQVPFEVTTGTSAPVVVTANGVVSASVLAPVASYAVGVFTYPRTASALDPIIVHAATNQLVTPSSPAQANEYLVVYATGVGNLVNAPLTGFGAATTPLASSVDTPTVTLGGAPVGVLFAGLTPGFVGLVQINIQLPATLPSGSSAPLVIQFPNNSTVPVNLSLPGTGGGGGGSAPKLSLSATSLAFGNITVGQTKDLSVTVSNTGNATLNVSSISISGTGFSLTTASSFAVSAGGSQTITVRFGPASATSVTGTLTITSNDAASPASVLLSGTGVVAAAPSISITPTSLNFGTVTSGQTKDLTFTVSNKGNAALQVNSVTSSNPRFTEASPGTSFSVASGSSQVVTIRFSPTAAGAQNGTITVASNDAANPSVTVSVTGTGGSGSTPVDVILSVDGGSYNYEVGFPSGTATAYFVTRLTPPSYPATIKSVVVYFSTRSDGVTLNQPITILSMTNPSGSASLAPGFAGTTDTVSGLINALDTYLVYTVPQRTITSGDFVVGFKVGNPPNIYPADEDQVTPSAQRSYVSTDGVTFTLLDSISPSLAGNLAIRAVVTVSR